VLTVPEAARRAGRNPETIRRWIRSGRLPATKVGTQHVIDEGDLEAVLLDGVEAAPIPPEWGPSDPRLTKLIVGLIREDRDRGH
jgi:excisionase family DNA binding protein